jgi:hypothetical protein
MKYMLLMYFDETIGTPATPEEYQVVGQRWAALRQEMQSAGVLIANNGLSSVSDATTVRVREGKILTADGPFAETHEQLGGYFLIECNDLDEATAWAAKIPSAEYGSIEVRPVWGG